MNAEIRISVAGGHGNLDDLRAAAQAAVNAVHGGGAVVNAELRHGNPGMPTVEPITATLVDTTAEGLVDENEITQAAFRNEQAALAQAGETVAESRDKQTPAFVEAGAQAAPANETEREAAKVKSGAPTADAAGIPPVETDADRAAAKAATDAETARTATKTTAKKSARKTSR